jgi:hypothetical protein
LTTGSKPIPWGIGKIMSKADNLINAAAAQPSSTSTPVADEGKDHFSSILMQKQTPSPPNPSAVLNGVRHQIGSSANKIATSFGFVSASIVGLMALL